MSQGYTKVLDAIKKHQGEHLTVRRICELTGISNTSTVHRYIKLLEDAGIVQRVQTYEVISGANSGTPIKPITKKKKQKQKKKVLDPAKAQERIQQLREVVGFD